MVTYIFESVQVLVPLTADLALVRLLLLHAECARVWRRCLRVDDGEGAVAVLMQLLRLVTVRLVVSGRMKSEEAARVAETSEYILQAILVLIRLLTSNDRTPKGLVFLPYH